MLESTKLHSYLNKDSDNEIYLELNKDEVLLAILDKGVTYPSEISRNTSINIESVNKILGMFCKYGYIKKIIPDQYSPQPIFRDRIPELWSMGIVGFQRMIQISWWTLTLGGFEYIKQKYKGQGKKIQQPLMDYLGLQEL